tara:strand:+ start:481 stop:924 length:444 start_codon:yes stop_codon:yes gene_type:complete
MPFNDKTTDGSKNLMSGLMGGVDEALQQATGKKHGAVLLVFGMDDPMMANYIANVDRKDAAQALIATGMRLAGESAPNHDKLDQLISMKQGHLKHMKEALPYADGQAYYKDKQQISELEQELAYWQSVKQQLSAAKLYNAEHSGGVQ